MMINYLKSHLADSDVYNLQKTILQNVYYSYEDKSNWQNTVQAT